jgi:hypothetical protein
LGAETFLIRRKKKDLTQRALRPDTEIAEKRGRKPKSTGRSACATAATPAWSIFYENLTRWLVCS